MRYAVLIFVMIVSVSAGFSQGDGKVDTDYINKKPYLAIYQLVDTEHEFAARAARVGTKPAFLAFMTDDAVVFTPDRTNARQFWTKRQPKAGTLLSWAPNFADVSSSGALGYTTGNWEFRS